MRHSRFFLMLAMLALAGIAQAANDKLVIQDVTMEAGSSVTLEVALENETTNLMGFQCDIVLPEGLTLKLKNNGKPEAKLGSRFEDTVHSISSSVTSSGAYRFIATSMDGEAIPETSGTLFTVTLQADASLESGTALTGLVKNIEFNTQDNQKLTFSDVTFDVTIPGVTPPDPVDPDNPDNPDEPVKPNRLVIQDMTMEAGTNVAMNVELVNEVTNLMGFQCDIVLPEGLTLKLKNNGKPEAKLGSRFEDTVHSISSSVTSSGAYRFIATSMDGEAIPGASGTLFTVTLQADASLVPGTKLTGLVKSIEFNTQDNQKVVFDDVKFNVGIPGEVETLNVTVISTTREYGDANPTFEYSVEGGELAGAPEITCDATPTSPVGTYDIVISQGTVTNSNVTFTNGTLTITKAPLTIKAGDYTKKQGEQNPEFTLTFEGFKNDETSEVLTKQPTVSCEATETSAPGEYDVTVGGAEAQNYDITYVNGKLTVTDTDPITITAKSYTREYGDSNPIFEFITEGATLDGTPEIVCEATQTSPVGEYPIIIKKGSVTNYNDTYVNGTLTITKAPLTIKAGDYTKKQGEQNPEFTLTFEGFKNDETSEVLTKQPTVSCEATETSAPGEYDVTVSGAEAQNYEITYVNGKLTITDLLVQTLDLTELPAMTYGDGAFALPQQTTEGLALTWSVGDATVANITDNSLSILKAGTTTVTATQAGNENYKPFEREFTLTIGKAMLTITANDCTKQVGEENPELTVSYAGFKYNDDSSSLTTQPTVTTTATTDSPAGRYPITASGAASDNYDFTYVEGTLIVTTSDSSPVITFADASVKELCVAKWDTNGDGELSTSEAETVTDLGEVFGGSEITSFNELASFTSLTSIGDNAFSSCQYLSDIAIPQSITTIGSNAFNGCVSLSTITLPKTVTSIGDNAFASSGLAAVTIPNSVTAMGAGAFSGCADLTNVKIGNGVSSIEDETFANCENLSSVKMGRNIKSIGQNAFLNCRGLASVTLPDFLESIGDGAFQSTSLTSITIPESVEFIGNDAFRDCARLASISFEEDIYTSIGDSAFRGCALTSVTIPEDGVEEIGEYAFAENAHLTTVIIGEGITEIEAGLFQGCSALTSVIIPEGVTSIGSQAFKDCDALTSVKLPEYLTSLGENVFPASMTSIELPNSFTVISEGLFSANDFQYIRLGNRVKSIGKNAFGSSEPVIEIETPTPPSIASDAFPNVEYLADINVIVPNATAVTAYRKATVWKEMEFSNQDNIAEVTVDTPGDLSWELLDDCGIQAAKVVGLKVNGTINAADFTQMRVNMKSLLRLDLSDCNITDIPDGALNGKSQLRELTLPARLQTIGKDAFHGCTYLTGQLDLPTTLTTIGESAFVGTDYTTVKLPATLKTIGDYAFNNVPITQKLNLPDRVISVGASAFAGTQITGLAIRDGITSIGDYAFAGTPIQGHVTIPDGVTYLGKGAFQYSQLSTVFLPNSVAELSEGVFQGCQNLNLVYVPDNYTGLAAAAFDGCGALTILRLSANLASMEEYSFQNTPLEYLKIPSQVEVLSRGVLKNCKNLESLTLSANMKTVESEALYGCTALRNLSVESVTPPVIKDRSAIRGINTDLCIISIPTSAYRNYVLAEYWGQFVQMRNDIAVETAGNGEIAFESVEENEDEDSPNLRPSFARGRKRVSSLASEEESMTYANNGSSVYVPQQGQVRFYIIPAEGEEILSATLDGEDITPYIVDGVYTATADKKNAKLVVVFSGEGQGDVAQAGDVNGDGDIDIVDVTSTIGYVIHQVPANFIFKAADVNNDGTVDIVDVTSIIDMIINKGKNVKEFNIEDAGYDPQ